MKIAMQPGPLWRPSVWPGLWEEVRYETVWQPYFQEWLMDVLRYDVFEQVGKMTDFNSLIDHIAPRKAHGGEILALPVITCRLAGEFDKAEEFERILSASDREDYNFFFNRDIEALCTACHAAEAQTAKKLKLGDAWQPTPFPVELPKIDSAAANF